MNVFLFPINLVFPTPTELVAIKNSCTTLRQEIQLGNFCLVNHFNLVNQAALNIRIKNYGSHSYNLDSI